MFIAAWGYHGKLSRTDCGVIVGHLKDGDDLEPGQEAARVCALRCLSVMSDVHGGIDNIDRILSVRGMVNASPDFRDHPRVLDAASDLIERIFVAGGRHVRTAIGVSSLTTGGLVEMEMTASML